MANTENTFIVRLEYGGMRFENMVSGGREVDDKIGQMSERHGIEIHAFDTNGEDVIVAARGRVTLTKQRAAFTVLNGA